MNHAKNNRLPDLDPDEIFLDSTNLPQFNVHQLEGRLEKPISKKTVYVFGVFCLLTAIVIFGRLWFLEIKNGNKYASQSENNRLTNHVIYAERGVIFDRNGIVLASNIKNEADPLFLLRKYSDDPGLGHLLGYVKYPKKDSSGIYYDTMITGMDGIERAYDDQLTGQKGKKIIETNALGDIQSESVVEPAIDGENLTLSVDSKVQTALYNIIEKVATDSKFQGGAAVIMDLKNGEIIAMPSYPEYSPQVLTDGKKISVIQNLNKDIRKPFLNRVIDGLYTPGSIVKPFIALGALNEKIIDPKTKIISTGSISIPNQYDPTKRSVFRDWKAHGPVDMREALAVSSDVYFYEIGGGFEDQAGLGVEKLEKYLRLFGLGEQVDEQYLAGEIGIIPNPAWKAENFAGENWRVGDTYNTSIGQYGMQITPIQAVRSVSAVANDGVLLEPTILISAKNPVSKKIAVPAEYWKIVKEGMRLAVTEGTAKGLYIPQTTVAAKTGTAELGASKKYVNSWVIGFFPYEKPRYAFATIMEKGPVENTIGALYVTRQIIEWMSVNAEGYLKP